MEVEVEVVGGEDGVGKKQRQHSAGLEVQMGMIIDSCAALLLKCRIDRSMVLRQSEACNVVVRLQVHI